jgi:sulfate permease, SulP family
MLKTRFQAFAFAPDFAGGLTTAIVSLPMALAFGVASGLGAQAGLTGAVFVGLFAALFGSSSRLISEPTGPMTVVMTAVLANLAASDPEQAPAMAFTVVMLAGLVQILIGRLKLGQFITLMPYAVISGFMSGIGVLLILMQLPPFLGSPPPPGGALGVLRALPDLLRNPDPAEIGLALLAFAILWFWPPAWRKRIPPHLFALIACTLIGLFWIGTDSLRVLGEIPTALPRLRLPAFTPSQTTRILVDGLILGLLGCIDTLLTAMIADSLTREEHDSNRELTGQGIANLLSGLFGGLPGAGATMGTVVNIQTGAKSPAAGVIRALLLLVILLGAAPLLAPVPMAVLAAIAVKVGFDILDWSFMKRAHRVSTSSTLLMYGVLLLTVFVDLIVAVGIGVFIANILTIKRLSDLHSQSVSSFSTPDAGLHLSSEEHDILRGTGDALVLFHMSGPMIFGVAKAIAREHAAMKRARALVLDLTDVPLLGVTVSLAIENMVLDAIAQHARVWIVGARGKTRARLEDFGFFQHPGLTEAPDRLTALREATQIIDMSRK